MLRHVIVPLGETALKLIFRISFVVIVVYVDVTCVAVIGIHVAAIVTTHSKGVKPC